MTAAVPADQVIGQALPRLEDARHLAGRSSFVADATMPGCVEVAFLRSPVAHGRLLGIDVPAWIDRSQVWSAAEIAPLTVPIVGRLLREGFNAAPMPLLATDRVRYVGEAIAAVTAPTRAAAEDIVEELTPDIDALPVVLDAWREVQQGSAPIHAGLSSNVIMRTARQFGDAAVFEGSQGLRKLTRRFSMARLLASPLEGRGCLAYVDQATGELVLRVSHQRPHLLRSFVAEHLVGIAESDIRVIVPDVGGGFGTKSNLYPEELVVAAMALKTGRPHRWIEDRYEHFVASNHSREHEHEISAWFDDSGRIHAIDAKIVVDGGAYSAKTSTGTIEANMAATVMLGPYDIRNYRFEAIGVYTNKTPVGPFRGVGRPAACFAMERIIDEVALTLGRDPIELRRLNAISADRFPYRTAAGQLYDSGNYDQALCAARDFVGEHWPPAPADGAAGTDTGRYRFGIGYAMYVEQAAHGAEEWHRRGSPTIYGHEAARASLSFDGTLVIEVGTLSHGQGHFTSLAQIAAQITGIDVGSIRIRQGDTSRAPYGMGSVASRSIVMGGGAVAVAARALLEKARRIAGAALDCETSALMRIGDAFHAPDGRSISYGAIARLSLVELQRLPRDIDPGMTVEGVYRPAVETGTFSYGVHAARVCVDLRTGLVKLTHYVVAEDCGTLVNPLIVDGQIRGGVAQGIGQALLEQMRYSDQGQPLCVTFGDYALPSPIEVPRIDIVHLCTPSPISEFGIKGMGEGGCVGPPAAIANAVRQALRQFDIDIDRTPISPDDLLARISDARARSSTSS
ncbi:MAG: xanthine dehydrogenase family protein [Burkholderiales bacterium]|nr:xanthine dehydrogenase family protein [Burkholderiales bacterium]